MKDKKYYVEPFRTFWFRSKVDKDNNIINTKGSKIIYFIRKRRFLLKDKYLGRFDDINQALDRVMELNRD